MNTPNGEGGPFEELRGGLGNVARNVPGAARRRLPRPRRIGRHLLMLGKLDPGLPFHVVQKLTRRRHRGEFFGGLLHRAVDLRPRRLEPSRDPSGTRQTLR